MRRKLVRIGNSLGVTLPATAIESLGVAEGDAIDLEVEDGQVVIRAKPGFMDVVNGWTPVAADLDAAVVDRLIREDREAR